MKCPKCDKQMIIVNQSITENNQTDPIKKYDKIVYHCELDDIWINTEIPQNNS